MEHKEAGRFNTAPTYFCQPKGFFAWLLLRGGDWSAAGYSDGLVGESGHVFKTGF